MLSSKSQFFGSSRQGSSMLASAAVGNADELIEQSGISSLMGSSGYMHRAPAQKAYDQDMTTRSQYQHSDMLDLISNQQTSLRVAP